jgi:hypothetical protein
MHQTTTIAPSFGPSLPPQVLSPVELLVGRCLEVEARLVAADQGEGGSPGEHGPGRARSTLDLVSQAVTTTDTINTDTESRRFQ